MYSETIHRDLIDTVIEIAGEPEITAVYTETIKQRIRELEKNKYTLPVLEKNNMRRIILNYENLGKLIVELSLEPSDEYDDKALVIYANSILKNGSLTDTMKAAVALDMAGKHIDIPVESNKKGIYQCIIKGDVERLSKRTKIRNIDDVIAFCYAGKPVNGRKLLKVISGVKENKNIYSYFLKKYLSGKRMEPVLESLLENGKLNKYSIINELTGCGNPEVTRLLKSYYENHSFPKVSDALKKPLKKFIRQENLKDLLKASVDLAAAAGIGIHSFLNSFRKGDYLSGVAELSLSALLTALASGKISFISLRKLR